MVYGQILCKCPTNSELVNEHYKFFLAYHLSKLHNRPMLDFDPDGEFVVIASDFIQEDFHGLYIPFRHRYIKPQNFILSVDIMNFTEQKWLDHAATVLYSLNSLDGYEKKNLLRFAKKELSMEEKLRLESPQILITSSEDYLADEWISCLKSALTNTLVCTKCVVGFANDQVKLYKLVKAPQTSF